MTDPMQAATAAWYAVKNDTRSPSPTADPLPYIAAIVRAILAAKDAEIAGMRANDVRYRWLRECADWVSWHILVDRREPEEWDAEIDARMAEDATDAAISALAGEGVEGV